MAELPRLYSPYDRPMWESIQEQAMALQRCVGCGRFRYPPGACCPGCLSTEAEWVPVSGRGRVLSWTTYHRQYLPGYPPPHTCVAVQLEEGPIVVSNVDAEAVADLAVDRVVTMFYGTHPVDGYTLPRFRVAPVHPGERPAVTGEPRCLGEPAAVLGEAPLWDGPGRRLLWVDCDQKLLFEHDPETGMLGQSPLPHSPGSYALRRQGGMVMAYRNALVLFDEGGGEEEPIEAPGVDFALERFNDGACDRAGRFWVGTMDKRLTDPLGSLFRLDPDRSLHRIERHITCSNGIAFSPDDRTMYHTDTGAGQIYAYHFDLDTGGVSDRQVFADFRYEPGRPDGCTLDGEGCLWVAEVGGGQVVRLDPSGRQIGAIALPVERPTSVTLGGSGLRTLYITTMRHGMTAEQVARCPQAGCTFAVEVDVAGLPEARFAG